MLGHGFVDCVIYTRVRNGGRRGVMKGLGLIPFGYGHMLTSLYIMCMHLILNSPANVCMFWSRTNQYKGGNSLANWPALQWWD